jgi:hypothetical protein
MTDLTITHLILLSAIHTYYKKGVEWGRYLLLVEHIGVIIF